MIEYIIAALVCAGVGGGVTLVLTPLLIRTLKARNIVVPDAHKSKGTTVPHPAGPAILAGFVAGELALYAMFPSDGLVAVILATSTAFVVGLMDDIRIMGGWFKPLALVAAAIPILVIGAYDTDLAFPFFGIVRIPILYMGVVVAMMVIIGNTLNSIDVLNGVASAFMVIAGIGLAISLCIMGRHEAALGCVPIIAVSLALYHYHKNPSKIFPGNSGALTLGCMYGSVAIMGGAEVIAAIIILPAILNSFLFLSSMRRVIEHRELQARPTRLLDDLRLAATDDPRSPVTLVRLLLLSGPMTESQITRAILWLGVFSACLGIATAAISHVVNPI